MAREMKLMNTKNAKFVAIAVLGICLAFPAFSSAGALLPLNVALDSSGLNDFDGEKESVAAVQKVVQNQTDILSFPTHEAKPRPISDTAKRYYKIGVKNYKKEKFKEAKIAFEAFLRTSDSALRKNVYYYLANIHSKQGDERQSLFYVKAFHGFNNVYVTEDCITLVASLDSEFLELLDSVSLGLISQDEFEPKLIELVDKQGPTFAQACQLISKNRAGHAEFLDGG